MILKATITQHTTDEVFITVKHNPTRAQVDISIDPQDASRLLINTDNEIFDDINPSGRYYIANKDLAVFSVTIMNRKQLEVKMWANGVETSNILNNCEFEV